MKPRPRKGKTTTFSVSVNAQAKAELKAAADRLHHGNMSQLFASIARRLTEEAAFDRAWACYGGPLPTEAETREVDAWIDGVVKGSKRKRHVA